MGVYVCLVVLFSRRRWVQEVLWEDEMSVPRIAKRGFLCRGKHAEEARPTTIGHADLRPVPLAALFVATCLTGHTNDVPKPRRRTTALASAFALFGFEQLKALPGYSLVYLRH
jgi:hypothetical protein